MLESLIHSAVMKVLKEVQLLRAEVRQVHDAVRKLAQQVATAPASKPGPRSK